MNISKRLGLGLAIVGAATLALLATSQASASFENIVMSRATVEPGARATVHLTAEDINEPGLGAWEIGIIYDPSVARAVGCEGASGSFCNDEFASNQVRVTGASANGVGTGPGPSMLASIVFECDDNSGTTALTLALDVVADATKGSPQPLEVKQLDGSITCTDAPFSPPPGQTPSDDDDDDDGGGNGGPAPTQGVSGLPSSGVGTGSGGNGLAWLIAASAAAGIVATAAGYAMLTVRRRSDD